MNDQIVKFLAKNADLPVSWQGLTLRIFQADSGKLAMMLEIGPATTQANLKNAWADIRDWKKRLTVWQGSWGFGSTSIYEQLLQKHTDGASYSVLAQDLNQEIEDNLQSFVTAKQTVSKIDPNLGWLAGPGRGIFGIHRARDLLQALIPTADSEVWLASAIENIEAGERAFPPSAPVTDGDVRERIRSWKQKRGSKDLGRSD